MQTLTGLKCIREARGMTQKQLAGELNMAQSNVAMWESGAVLPSAGKLPQLADILNCSIDALFGRELNKEVHYAKEIRGPQADR